MTAHPYPYDERPEIQPHVAPDARAILDVGCSRGGFGMGLRRRSADLTIWGIEPDEGAAEEARRSYDNVVVGLFPEALDHTAPPAFDCIVFNDVLEHTPDPWSVLSSSHRHLAEGGTVVASIPNVRALQVLIDLVVRGDWRYTEMGILDRTHLRFFTRRSMVRLFEGTGFTVRSVTGIFPYGTRWRMAGLLTLLLRDIAYREFVVVAHPER